MTNNKAMIRKILATASTLAITLGAAEAIAVPVITNDLDVQLTAGGRGANGAANDGALKMHDANVELNVVAGGGDAFARIQGVDTAGQTGAKLNAGAGEFTLGVVVDSTKVPDPAAANQKLQIEFTGASKLVLDGSFAGDIETFDAVGPALPAGANNYTALGNIDFKNHDAALELNVADDAIPVVITSNIGSTTDDDTGNVYVLNGNASFTGNLGGFGHALNQIAVDFEKKATFSGAVVNTKDIVIGADDGHGNAGNGEMTFGSNVDNGTDIQGTDGFVGRGANNTIKIQNKAILNTAVRDGIEMIEIQNGAELTVNDKAIDAGALIKAAVNGEGELVLKNVNTHANIAGNAAKLKKVTLEGLNGGVAANAAVNLPVAATPLNDEVHAVTLHLKDTKLQLNNNIKSGAITGEAASSLEFEGGDIDADYTIGTAAAPINTTLTEDDDRTLIIKKAIYGDILNQHADRLTVNVAENTKVKGNFGTDATKLKAVNIANDKTLEVDGNVYAAVTLGDATSRFNLADNGSAGVVNGAGIFNTEGTALLTGNIGENAGRSLAEFNMIGDNAKVVTSHADAIHADAITQESVALKLERNLSMHGAYTSAGSTIALGDKTLTFRGANATFNGNNTITLDFTDNLNFGKINVDGAEIGLDVGAAMNVIVNLNAATPFTQEIQFINGFAAGIDPALVVFKVNNPDGVELNMAANYERVADLGTLKFKPNPQIAIDEAARVEAARVAAEEAARVAAEEEARRRAANLLAQQNQANNKIDIKIPDEVREIVHDIPLEKITVEHVPLIENAIDLVKPEEQAKARTLFAEAIHTRFVDAQKDSKNADALNDFAQRVVDAALEQAKTEPKKVHHTYEAVKQALATAANTSSERMHHMITHSDRNSDKKIDVHTLTIMAANAEKLERTQHEAVATTAVAHAGAAVHASIDSVTSRTASIVTPNVAPSVAPAAVPAMNNNNNIGGSDLQASAGGVAAGSSVEKYGVWGQVMGGIASQRARKGASGFKSNMVGSIIGADTMINDAATIGLAFGNVANNVKMKNLQAGDKTRSSSWIVSGYGNYQFDNNFFIRGAVAYTRTAVDNKEKRTINTTTSGIARAKYNINSFGGELTVGKAFAAGSATVIPSIGARVTRTGKISYKETGDTGLNTAITQGAMNSLYGIAGLQVTKSFTYGGAIVTPEAHIGMQYGLSMKTPKGKFVSQLDNQSVSYVGNKPSRFTSNLGVGVMASSSAVEYGIGYDATIGAGYVGHQGTLKLKVHF